MTSLGEKAATLGKSTADLAIKGLQTGVNLASKATETAEVVGVAGLDAAGNVTTNAGKIVSSASGIVADTVGITADLIARTHAISENAVKRQTELEKQKNSINTDNIKLNITKSQVETENNILQIQKKAEIEKLTLIEEAEKKKRIIEAKADKAKIQSQINKQLTEEENIANQKNVDECLAYGFKTDESPYEEGSTQITKYFDWFKKRNQNFFGYYVPIGVLNTETLELFNIVLPTKSDTNETRIPNKLKCQDENGNVVTINFKTVAIKRRFRDPEMKIKPFVTVNENGTERSIDGELVFQKRSYFTYKEVTFGGKSRRQIKKRRVGGKKTQKTKKRNTTKTRNKRRTKL